MTIEAMRRSCAIFKKLGGSDFEITSPEVESLWTVYIDKTPIEKQINELGGLGWFYDEEVKSFSQYF